MEILVSNLNLSVIESDLRRLFTPFGEIASVELLRDKWNHRSTGRANVSMPVAAQANHAVLTLHGTVLAGKSITVTALS